MEKIFPTREKYYQKIEEALNSMRKDPLISKEAIKFLEDSQKSFNPLGFKEKIANWWEKIRMGKLEKLHPKSLEAEDVAQTILEFFDERSGWTIPSAHVILGIDAPVQNLIEALNLLKEKKHITIVQDKDEPLTEENFEMAKIKIIR